MGLQSSAVLGKGPITTADAFCNAIGGMQVLITEANLTTERKTLEWFRTKVASMISRRRLTVMTPAALDAAQRAHEAYIEQLES